MKPTAVFYCLILLALGGCASLMIPDFDEPEVEVVGLEPLPSRGLEARFLVRLRVVNPNDVGLELSGVYYELFIEGSKLLSGASSNPVNLPAYGEAILELEAAASMLGSISLVQKLISDPPSNGIGYELRTKLSIRHWPTSIQIQHEGRIGAPQAPAMSTLQELGKRP